LPIVSFTGNPDTVCTSSGTSIFTGNPAGGTFTGSGITDTLFIPSQATVGMDTIRYTYTDTSGCTNSTYQLVNVTICTGINALANANNSLHIYPNPTSGMVTISFVSSEEGTYSIKLSDMTGREVRNESHAIHSGLNTDEMNLTNIQKGMYLAEVIFKANISRVKLIVE
jgi:hypothetical protein